MEMVGEGAEREGGERFVPLFVWKQPSFQSWYQAQTGAGNRLDEARVLYSFRPRYKSFVFLWILKAKIYVTSEDRFKDNEFVLSRTDISSVCLWHNSSDPGEDRQTNKTNFYRERHVVIVKEFRTPSSSEDGFERELPGGSSVKEGDPKETAAEEVHEETGFYLDPDRLRSRGARQLAGTLSAHKAHLYSAEIDKKEMEWFRSQKDTVHGNAEDTERTFIEVYSVQDLLDEEIVDWTTLGQILSVIKNTY
jgi:8-oxo-dGTP pyrophosphatase MutT (NUDIX family)